MNGLSVAQGLRNPVDLRFQVHEAAHGDLCGSWDSWESGEQHSWNVFFCLANGHPKKFYKNSMLPWES